MDLARSANYQHGWAGAAAATGSFHRTTHVWSVAVLDEIKAKVGRVFAHANAGHFSHLRDSADSADSDSYIFHRDRDGVSARSNSAVENLERRLQPSLKRRAKDVHRPTTSLYPGWRPRPSCSRIVC